MKYIISNSSSASISISTSISPHSKYVDKSTVIGLSKHRIKYGTLVIIALLFAISTSCNNDDDNHTGDPLDQLPPATQTGENTAGCLVNGEAFLPNSGSVVPLNLNYLDGEDFTLKIGNEIDGIPYSMLISIYDNPLTEGVTYLLNTEFNDTPSAGEYTIENDSPPSPFYYSTTPNVTGELTITNFDFDNAILSGTFWFDAINSEGDIVEVREGRFDMEY